MVKTGTIRICKNKNKLKITCQNRNKLARTSTISICKNKNKFKRTTTIKTYIFRQKFLFCPKISNIASMS